MKNRMSKAKRFVAMALTLAIMLTTLGGYAPGWFAAFAEGEAAQTEVKPQENAPSEPEEEKKGETPQDETPATDETPAGDEAPTSDETPARDETLASDETPANDETAQKPSPLGEGGAVAPEEVVLYNETSSENKSEEETTSSVSPDGEPASPEGEAFGGESDSAEEIDETNDDDTQKPSPDGEGVAAQSAVTEEVSNTDTPSDDEADGISEEVTPASTKDEDVPANEDLISQREALTDGASQPDHAENSPLESFPGAAVSPEGKPFGDESLTEEETPANDETPASDEAAQKPSPGGEGGAIAPDEVSEDADAAGETNDEATSSVSPDGEPASPQGEAIGDEATEQNDSTDASDTEAGDAEEAAQKPFPSGEGGAIAPEEVVLYDETSSENVSEEETTSSVSPDDEPEGAYRPGHAENSPQESFPGAAAPAEGEAIGNEAAEQKGGADIPATEAGEADEVDESAEEENSLRHGDDVTPPSEREAFGDEEATDEATPNGSLPEGAGSAIAETEGVASKGEELPATNDSAAAPATETPAETPVEAPVVPTPQPLPEAPNALETTPMIVVAPVTVYEVAPAALASGNTSGETPTPKTGISVLQQKIIDIMKGTLTGKKQIILDRNVTYEANNTPDDEKWNNKILISAEDYDIKDDFELELVAEDAGDTGMEGDGFTTIDANLVIQGVKVVMKSVMMAVGRTITVANGKADKSGGGKLTFYGSDNVPNNLTVSVEDKSSAEIYTASDDDVINVAAKSGAVSLVVDAGEGFNQVNVDVGGGAVDVKTGASTDTVVLNISNANQGVRVDTGMGNDTLNITDNGKAASGKELAVNAGMGDDTVSLDVRANAGNMTVNTGTGADEVTVFKGDNRSIENLDYNANDNQTEAVKTGTGAKITFVNGDSVSVDRFTVDANSGLAVDEIHLEGGAGASVYLRGKLSPKDKLPEGVTNPLGYIDPKAPSKGLQLRVASGQDEPETAKKADLKLKITYADPAKYNFTDALQNKKRVEVYPTGKDTYEIEATDDFTDYVIKTAISTDIKSIFVKHGITGNLMLSNLVLDADIMGDDEPYLPAIDAPMMNVLIKAKTININKSILARNLRAESSQGSLSLNAALEDISAGVSVGDILHDLFCAADAARINVNARIETGRDIALVARVKHFGGLLSVLPESLNLINVKIAKAAVTLGSNAQLTAHGSVTAEAKIDTTLGYTSENDYTNKTETQTQEGGPVGIDIVVNSASVKAEQGSQVNATNDAVFAATSDVRDYNYAFYGAWKSPLAAAVTVVCNTVDVLADGKLNADNKVKLNATGTVNANAEASYQTGVSASGDGATGGFVAVNVVNQNVNAVIGEHATVKATRGDVSVYATRIANVRTIANSGGDHNGYSESSALGTSLGNFAGVLFGKLTPILKEKIWEKFKYSIIDKEAETLIKTVTRISAGNYKLNVVNLTEDDKQGGSATVKSMVGDKLDDDGNYATFGIVEPTPNEGWEVDAVLIRFLVPGDDHYTYQEVKKNNKGKYVFTLEHDDVEVMVGFKKPGQKSTLDKNRLLKDELVIDIDDEDELEDAIDIGRLIDDAEESVDGDGDDDFVIEGGADEKKDEKKDEKDDDFIIEGDDDDDKLIKDDDQSVKREHTLVLKNDDKAFISGGGKIVTWTTDKDGKNITKVTTGQEVRFVPNPDEGKALTSLSLVYSYTKDDVEVTEEIKVAADRLGRYIFTVPDDLNKSVEFTVKATFGDEPEGAKQPAHKQITGAAAVGVTLNKGAARIESGSTVTAGGAVDMLGIEITRTDTYADGTAVEMKDAEAVDKENNQPRTVQKIKYSVAGANVALKVTGTVAGQIDSNIKLGEGYSAVTPHITYKLDDAYKDKVKSVEAIVTYYKHTPTSNDKATRKSETVDVTGDAENGYVVNFNSSKYAAVNGSTVEVTFLFKDEKGNVITGEGGEAPSKYVVPNAIRINMNQLKEKDAKEPKSLGELNFVSVGEDENKNPIYKFRIQNVADGYKCDPADGGYKEGSTDKEYTKSNKKTLSASWTDQDGYTQTTSLRQDASDSTIWYLKAVDGDIAIPEGAVITVNAVFSEDTRSVKLNYGEDNKDGEKYGTATVSRDEAKQGDKFTVSLTAKDGWIPVGVNVLLLTGTTKQTRRLDEANVVSKGNGVWEVTAPKYKDGEVMTVQPLFNAKTIDLKVAGDVQVQFSEADKKAAKGQTITIQPTAEDIKAGKKLDLSNTEVTYQGHKLAVNDKGEFTIPKGDEYNATELTIKAALKEKEYTIGSYTSLEGDKIEPVSGKADPGEKVTLKIVPRDGYRAKGGTVKVTVATKDTKGNINTRQIVADWAAKNTYTFTLPEPDGTVESVTVKGEFEEGGDGVAFGMGVAAAVNVAIARNTVEIQGDRTIEYKENKEKKTRNVAGAKVTAGGGLSLVGISIGGKSYAEAKAGFNEGDTGVAGALAVQVATTDTDAAVRKGAKLTVQGAASLFVRAKHDFKVSGDASGKKGRNEAGKTGVGAGIAVAVDALRTNALIEDGVVLNEGSNLTGLIVNASNEYRDRVSAKAGAAGGSAMVPVAAVDVFNSGVRAELGKLTGAAVANGVLPVNGRVTIKAAGESAKTQYNHELSADASARGDGTAIGGAFIVTWLVNDVKALLRQSVNAAEDVKVKSIAADALKAVAKAAATGGDEGSKKDGKGSADKQANRLMKGAGNMAGRYGGMDGGAIQNGAENRQNAETGEQTIAGAGSFVLNMMQNKSRAEVVDGVNVTTKGKLAVQSSNRTDATIRADASATHSDMGVGVGVAINVVTMDNIARVGNGTITAAELEVRADIAQAPTMVREMAAIEDMNAFSSALQAQIAEAIKQAMGEDLYKKLGWAGDMTSELAARIAQVVIDELNMNELFDKLSSGTGDMFVDAAKLLWERIKDFPQAFAEPLIEVIEETYGSIKGLTKGTVINILKTTWNQLSVQLLDNILETLRGSLLDGLKDVGACAIDMLTDKITGKGVSADKLKQTLKDALIKSAWDLLEKVIEDAVRDIGAQFPLINESNVNFGKMIYKKGIESLKDMIVPYVTTTFRQTVWDYEPLIARINEDGFTKTLKDIMRKALKESAVALTNEAIDAVVGKLDVKIEREAIEDRHIITTQAIAGSGAKGKSGTGSLAIAVANLTTLAEVADGAGEVNVTGDMIVDAEELRRVRTNSTAAVDERGEPDNNEGTGDSDDANTGGNDEATTTKTTPEGHHPAVTLTYGTGTRNVWFSELGNFDHLGIDTAEGYCIEQENVVRTYCLPDGTEVVDTLKFTVNDNSYDFGSITDGINMAGMTEEQRNALKINVDIRCTEVLKKLPSVQVDHYDAQLHYSKQITLSVEGREKNYDEAWGKRNDLAEITVPVEPGLKVRKIVVTNKKGDKLNYGVDDKDRITLASANDDEEVYVFKVPDGEVASIEVQFTQDDNPERIARQGRRASENRDRAGRTIGVGAAFTLTYGGSDVTAKIGERAKGVTAGTIAVTASSEHEEENYATAGADPFEGTSNDIKDMAIDAAVSVNILDNDVKAIIAKGGTVKTTAEPQASTGNKEEDEDKQEDLPEEIEVTSGSLILSAAEVARNEGRASAFATGSSTAVGASVAVNVSLSEITAALETPAEVSGKAVVRSHTLSKDNTWAFASAMGADIQRSLNKFADGVKATEKTANDLTTGKIFDEKKETKGTETNKKINQGLNRSKADNSKKVRDDVNVSTNVMRAQNVEVDNGGDAGQGANDAVSFVNVEGDQHVDNFENPNGEKKSLQVAAAVGVTVGLHKATTTVNGSIKAAQDVLMSATTAGNFNTRSTGAAMTLAKGEGKTIAAAVGVSVNKNEANATVNGDLTASGGDVTVSADLKQNLTDLYRGKLAVQSIAGAVSGKGSDISVAGAVSILVSSAESQAVVDGNLSGNAVSVTANDKSKLAVRAGGINVSKGTNVGAGVSVATIWSGDKVRAEVKDGATIDADSFTLKAVKSPVTIDDYKFGVALKDVITDTSDLDDEERKNVSTGLIDVHRKPGEKSYTVDFNLNTYNLMKFADALNFLSAKNYYTEAIAGSVVTGQADPNKPNALNAAGSISIVRTSNTVEAVLGNNVTISKNKKHSSGDVEILAQDDSTVRMLGGAAAVGNAKVSAGITVTFLYDKDKATATVGDNANISAGNVSHRADASIDVESYNVAASVSTASQGTASVGGALNIALLNSKAEAVVGSDAKIDAKGKLDVKADSKLNQVLISVSASVAKTAAAVGGTIAFSKNDSVANVTVGDRHTLAADGDVTVSANAVDKVVSILASASVAASDKAGAAGAISVLVDNAKGKVALGAGGSDNGVTSRGGSVTLAGEAETRAVNATAAGAGSKDMAIGLSANINVLQRESGVNVTGGEGYKISAAKDVAVTGYGRDVTTVVGMGVAAGKGLAIGGNLPILVSRNKLKTELGSATIDAGGEAAFASILDDKTRAVAGSLGLSMSNSAAAATAMFVSKKNEVVTDMGASSVTAAGRSGALAGKLRGDVKFNGIYVGSKVVDDIVAIAAGIALAGAHGITGNVLWSGNENIVKALADRASLTAIAKNANGAEVGGGSVAVEAMNHSDQVVLAGGLNGAKSVAAGASVVVITSAKDVTAKAHNAKAWQDVSVNAANDDSIAEIAISAGGAGDAAVEVGIAYQSLKSNVNAQVASQIEAVKGSFTLKSRNNVSLDNVAVALAGAGKVAVTPVFAVTAFTGESNAFLLGGTVKADKGVTVSAEAMKDLDQYTIGASGSGFVAVSGAVSVATLKDTTNALIANGTSITANTLEVLAKSDLDQVGASAAIAGSKDAAGAVNAMITVAKGNALAEMGGEATLADKAVVKATSDRDIIDVAATVAASGQVGVGLTVMGLIAGTRMSQDAADMLTYGSNKDKNTKSFDSAGIISYMKEKGVKDTSDLEQKKDASGKVTQTSLSDDLSGDGTSNANKSVGSKDGEFDVTSGYVDRDKDGNYQSNETKQLSETSDVKNVKNLTGSAYSADPQDAVVARIAANANVAAKGVNVYAEQNTRADVFGGTVAVGGTVAGAGVSISFAQLRSNVFAASLGTVDAKGGAVNVNAVSKSDSVKPKAGSDEEQRSSAINSHIGDSDDSEQRSTVTKLKDMVAKRSIRVMGLAVGVSGGIGVGVAGSIVKTDNITKATVGGSVKNASELNVNGKSDYGNVSALTLAAGGGTVGVSAAFAVALSNGTVESKLDNTADISGKDTRIAVTTYSDVNSKALSVTAGAGGIGAAAGWAQAGNDLKQETLVDSGAKINMTGDSGTLTVKGSSITDADSFLLGVSAGVTAVGLGIGVAMVNPTVKTGIGITGTGTVSLGKLASVNVLNDVSSQATTNMLSISAGAIAIQGNGLLVFNDTDATAKVANASGTLGSLKINGDLGAAAKSRFVGGAFGEFAGGLSIAYTDVDSINRAVLDTDNFTATVTGDLTVSTGENTNRKTEASATSVSAKGGALAVGLNAAVARDRAQNYATISGSRGLTAGTVKLNAYGKGEADAKFYGLSVGGASVAASVNVSLNETTSRATMKLGGALDGSLDANAQVDGATNATMYTGSGALFGLKLNLSIARGKTNSIIDVDVAKGQTENKKASITARNNGKNYVTAGIYNQSFEGLSVAGMGALAYSQDLYSAKVKLGGGKYDLSKVSVTTASDTKANAVVSPSDSGVDLAAVKIAFNAADAKSTAHAGAELELAGANLNVDGDVTVATNAKSETAAEVKATKFFNFSVIAVGMDMAFSNLSATQAATLRLNGGRIDKAGAVKVESLTDKAAATSVLGVSAVDDKDPPKGFGVKLAAVEVSKSITHENLTNTAAIIGSGRNASTIAAESLSVKADTGLVDGKHIETLAKSKTTSNTALSLLSGTGLLSDSTSSDSFNVLVTGVDVDVTGAIDLTSATRTSATAEGSAPGSVKLIDISRSEVTARVGSGGDSQTSKVLIGDHTTLSAGGAMTIAASNSGYARTDLTQKTASILKIKKTKMPTESWYDTGVSIGKNAILTSGQAMDITSTSAPSAHSVVDTFSFSLALNVDVMKGENTINDENNLTIGEGASLTAGKDLKLAAHNSAVMTAKSLYSGGGAIEGGSAKATNRLTRTARIVVGDGVSLEASDGELHIESVTGEGDKIHTRTELKGGGGVAVEKSIAQTFVTSTNEIIVGEGAYLFSQKNMRILSRATSRAADGTEGILTEAVADSGAVAVGTIAKGFTRLDFSNYIGINRDASQDKETTQLTSNEDIYITVDNAGLNVKNYSEALTIAAGGASKAYGYILAGLKNTIWVDSANLFARRNVDLLASNAGNGKKPSFTIESNAKMVAVLGFTGYAYPEAKIFLSVEDDEEDYDGDSVGVPFNQIRTNDAYYVTTRDSTENRFIHRAVNPKDDVIYDLKANQLDIRTGWSWKNRADETGLLWGDAKDRCDFCKTGSGANHRASAIPEIDSIAKALVPINDISRRVEGLDKMTKARYGEEENRAADAIYVLELEVPLKKDVSFDRENMDKYLLWKDVLTQHEVYLLPNATRLYTNVRLDYVSEVLRGDVRGDGVVYDIDIFTALNDYAFSHPVIPIGSSGSLDFTTGVFTLSVLSDFELYLNEVSGAWLLNMFEEGTLRRLDNDQDAINAYVLYGDETGGDLPGGDIVEGIADGGTRDGWRLYWAGDTPETAADADQTLVCLMHDEATDEIVALRTSRAMIEAGEAPVETSLFIYRDSKADRRGEVKYDAMFFDTPEGEKNLVKLITDVLDDRNLEMPKALEIVLRGYDVSGADYPAYSLTGHFFAMNDGTDGKVSMFDGDYQATFDGDVFESDYIRIEGIMDNDLNITVKKDQLIWPEHNGKTAAEDIQGDEYEYVDGIWGPKGAPEADAAQDGVAA